MAMLETLAITLQTVGELILVARAVMVTRAETDLLDPMDRTHGKPVKVVAMEATAEKAAVEKPVVMVRMPPASVGMAAMEAMDHPVETVPTVEMAATVSQGTMLDMVWTVNAAPTVRICSLPLNRFTPPFIRMKPWSTLR